MPPINFENAYADFGFGLKASGFADLGSWLEASPIVLKGNADLVYRPLAIKDLVDSFGAFLGFGMLGVPMLFKGGKNCHLQQSFSTAVATTRRAVMSKHATTDIITTYVYQMLLAHRPFRFCVKAVRMLREGIAKVQRRCQF